MELINKHYYYYFDACVAAAGNTRRPVRVHWKAETLASCTPNVNAHVCNWVYLDVLKQKRYTGRHPGVQWCNQKNNLNTFIED